MPCFENSAKYIGVKTILATPMTQGEYNAYRGFPIANTEDQKEGGFLVEYKDGYQSWTPEKPFFEAYKKVDNGTMSFGLAIEALLKGYKLARQGWNGKTQYIELATNVSYINPTGKAVNVNHDTMGNKAIAFVGTSGVQLGWLASQSDMLSNDWHIVDI